MLSLVLAAHFATALPQDLPHSLSVDRSVELPAAPVPAGFTWRDCGSTRSVNTSVVITPDPQRLGENWTIKYIFTLTDSVPEKIGEFSAIINATLNGKPVHQDVWDMCNVTGIAYSDGLGQCPYKAGKVQVIHDTNNLPSFLPKTGYHNRFTITSKMTGGETWLCLDVNQTYA